MHAMQEEAAEIKPALNVHGSFNLMKLLKSDRSVVSQPAKRRTTREILKKFGDANEWIISCPL